MHRPLPLHVAPAGFRLESRTLGAFPLVNHILDRLAIPDLLARVDAHAATRAGPTPSQCLGVLLRNLVLDRGPVYALAGWGSPVRNDMLGLEPGEADRLNDDRVGRALDHLFDADRASLQTEVVVRMIRTYRLKLDEVHNDSTTLKLTGAYAGADGGFKRGKRTVKATRGHSKDHRPDLKQLLWNLTVTADGAVPVHYKVYDGNQNDSPTHRETWDAVRVLKRSADFLYVADSKASSSDFLRYVDGEGGQFVVVLPRTRAEDGWFRDHVQAHAVEWTQVWPRREDDGAKGESPEDAWEGDVWSALEAPAPSAEGFRVVWLLGHDKAERDRRSRHAMVTRAVDGLKALDKRLRRPRSKITKRERIMEAADAIVEGPVGRWVSYEIHQEDAVRFKQEKRGRPGKDTRYRRLTKAKFRVVPRVDEGAIAYDAKSDGMFPLVTNTKAEEFSLEEVFDAYKYQPRLEKRHEQLKSVYAVTPVYLKKITRIEALLFLYFLAMIVQSLLEREVRRGMRRRGLTSIPLYPEGRACRTPTADKVLAAFETLQVHRLHKGGTLEEVFWPELSGLQRQLLELAGVSEGPYRDQEA